MFWALDTTRQLMLEKEMEEIMGEELTNEIINEFIKCFNVLSLDALKTAKKKGWWDSERNNGEIIALMHSELSEALEGLRHGNGPDDKIPDFNSAEAEFADVIIRIMDMSAKRGFRVGEAVIAKLFYNKDREYKHGGKLF